MRVSARCGDDAMIFKTNENFGGDTVTYSIVHITTYGRIQHRESFADSSDPDDRKISLLGFGERFFRYQEAYAIRQLTLKLKDSDSHVREKAASELIACFDFEKGINPRQRLLFVQNPANIGCLRALKTTVLAARSEPFNSDLNRPLSILLNLLSVHFEVEPVDR